MKALYGITNNNIYTIVNYIEEFKQTLPDEKKSRLVTQILGFNETTKANVRVLLVPSVALFTKQLSAINLTNAVVFVFDAAVLCQYLKPIKLLDVQSKTASYNYTFRQITYDYIIEMLLLGLRSTDHIQVETNTVRVIPSMLDQIRGRSLMQPILTFLYRIPDTDKRYRYQATILKWLVSSNELADLRKQLAITTDNQNQAENLLKCLCSPAGIEARGAVQEVLALRKTGKPVSYEKLAKKYPNIDIFDVRYILRTYKRIQSFSIENTELKHIFLQRKMKNEDEDNKIHRD